MTAFACSVDVGGPAARVPPGAPDPDNNDRLFWMLGVGSVLIIGLCLGIERCSVGSGESAPVAPNVVEGSGR